MNYLESFLLSCDRSEINLLRGIVFTPTEARLFDSLLTKKTSTLSNLSNSHYQKLSSVILSKCYKKLVPVEGIHLLFYLSSKGLQRHMLHEIHRQKRMAVASYNRTQLSQFYFGVFFVLQNYHFIDINIGMLRKYAKLYIATITKRNIANDLILAIAIETALFYNSFHKAKNNDLNIKRFEDKMAIIKKNLSLTDNHVCWWTYYRALYVFEIYTYKRMDLLHQYFLDAKPFVPLELIEIFPDFKYKMHVEHCRLFYLSGNYDSVLTAMETLWETFVDVQSGFGQFEMYIVAAIITNNYEKAERAIEKYAPNEIDSAYSTNSSSFALWMSMIALDKNNFVLASTLLLKASKLNKGKLFRREIEVQIRVLELGTAIFTKDWDKMEKLLVRHKQWLRRHKYINGSPEKLFISYIDSYLAKGYYNKSNGTLPELKLEDYVRGDIYGYYHNLLEKIFNTFAAQFKIK